MDSYQSQTAPEAFRLLHSARANIALEASGGDPCLRKMLGHVYTFEQIHDWILEQSPKRTYSRQTVTPEVYEAATMSYDEALMTNYPGLCGIASDSRSPSDLVISEEEVWPSDSDTDSDCSSDTMSTEGEDIFDTTCEAAAQLTLEGAEAPFLKISRNHENALASQKLAAAAKNESIDKLDGYWAQIPKVWSSVKCDEVLLEISS